MQKPDAWERDVQEWNEHTPTPALKKNDLWVLAGGDKLGLERARTTRTIPGSKHPLIPWKPENHGKSC